MFAGLYLGISDEDYILADTLDVFPSDIYSVFTRKKTAFCRNGKPEYFSALCIDIRVANVTQAFTIAEIYYFFITYIGKTNYHTIYLQKYAYKPAAAFVDYALKSFGKLTACVFRHVGEFCVYPFADKLIKRLAEHI